MMNESAGSQATVAGRLRQWIIVAGYVVGLCGIVKGVLTLPLLLPFINPSNIQTNFGGWNWIAVLTELVAPILLLMGCVGLQKRAAWGRRLLLVYAVFWLIGAAIVPAIRFMMVMEMTTILGRLSLGGAFIGSTVERSVLAVLLICYLRWPEVRKDIDGSPQGFEVLTSSPQAGPEGPD